MVERLLRSLHYAARRAGERRGREDRAAPVGMTKFRKGGLQIVQVSWGNQTYSSQLWGSGSRPVWIETSFVRRRAARELGAPVGIARSLP